MTTSQEEMDKVRHRLDSISRDQSQIEALMKKIAVELTMVRSELTEIRALLAAET